MSTAMSSPTSHGASFYVKEENEVGGRLLLLTLYMTTPIYILIYKAHHSMAFVGGNGERNQGKYRSDPAGFGTATTASSSSTTHGASITRVYVRYSGRVSKGRLVAISII